MNFVHWEAEIPEPLVEFFEHLKEGFSRGEDDAGEIVFSWSNEGETDDEFIDHMRRDLQWRIVDSPGIDEGL